MHIRLQILFLLETNSTFTGTRNALSCWRHKHLIKVKKENKTQHKTSQWNMRLKSWIFSASLTAQRVRRGNFPGDFCRAVLRERGGPGADPSLWGHLTWGRCSGGWGVPGQALSTVKIALSSREGAGLAELRWPCLLPQAPRWEPPEPWSEEKWQWFFPL